MKEIFKYASGLCIVLIFLSAVSCRKAPFDIKEKTHVDNFSEIFADFWRKMNTQYMYWHRDDTDWNSTYQIYKPLFEKLSDSDEDKAKAMSYFKEMTKNLIDHHYTITFNEPPLTGIKFSPALERKRIRSDYHSRFAYENIVVNYLDDGFVDERGQISDHGEYLRAITGKIQNNILYFRSNFFALKAAFNSKDNDNVKKVLHYFFDQLKAEPIVLKGIILDLRNNGGGNIEDLNFIAGKLIEKDLVFGYNRSKSGLGSLDYLPWLESRLKHQSGFNGKLPLAILTDSFSASLSEIMSIALRSDVNIVIGQQTFGATGPVSDPTIFNSGSFSVGKFLSVTTSSSEFKDINGVSFEGVGITPDIISPFNLKELLAGKDTTLEIAVNHLMKK